MMFLLLAAGDGKRRKNGLNCRELALAASESSNALLMTLLAAATSLIVSFFLVMRMGIVSGFDSVLLEGFYLGPNQEILEFPFTFRMQKDCNLVLYRNNVKSMWATNTMGMGEDCYFVLQEDGNGVLRTGDDRILWQTNTSDMNNVPHFIKMQCDGNVVMYTAYGYPIWATDTNVPPLTLMALQLAYNATHAAELEQTFVPPNYAHTFKGLVK